MKKNKDKIINIRLTDELYQKILEHCSKMGNLSVSAFLRLSAIEYIENSKKWLYGQIFGFQR